MPVYSQEYREFEGKVIRRMRWWIVARHEFYVLFHSRTFLILLLLNFLHFFARMLQIVVYNTIVQDPAHPLSQVLRTVSFLMVEPETYLEFIRIQGVAVILVYLFAGAGIVCNDMRNNLLEVYFAKPMTWVDYVFGKTVTLLLLGMGLTALPAYVLMLQHNLTGANAELMRESLTLVVPIVLSALAFVVPGLAGILACSTFIRSQRFAAITLFMVLFVNYALGTAISDLVGRGNFMILSVVTCANRFGQGMFGVEPADFRAHWGWALLTIGVVTFLCLGAVCFRLRQEEIA